MLPSNEKQRMKFLTGNIEGSRHLTARLLPFFTREKFDVLCLQEVFEADLALLEQTTGLRAIFCPMAQVTTPNPHLPVRGPWGLAILAADFLFKQTDYYVGHAAYLPEFFEQENPNSMNRMLLRACVRVAGQEFQLATTHFTWSGNGEVTDEQRQVFSRLQVLLQPLRPLILCGDFNTPRGGEIFDTLAQQLQDNIPSQIETTIDKNLHKSGHDIRLVVDGLFSSPEYRVKQVHIWPNTSDHMMVTAEIKSRAEV